MNLIKAAELLKGAPDSELDQYLQNPTGEFPEYLVASEKLRREDMRQRFANQGQPSKTSIIDELLQKDTQQLRQKMQPQQMPQQMPPEAMGLGSVPPPEGMQLSQAPMMEAAQQQPQQFYDGGVVALNGGGDPRDYQLSQMLGIQPTNMGGLNQEEMDAGRAREMAMREILAEKRMNGQLGMPDMYGDGTNIGPVNLSGQYTPRFNQASGRAGVSQPMAGGIANIGVMGTHDASGDKISGYNASYQNPEFNAALNVSPTGRYSGRLGRDGYGVSADVGKSLERVGADYSNGQTMGGINYMPGQGSVQGQVLHRLSPDSQVSVGGQYGKHKDINARYIQQLLNGELDIGGGYGDRGAYGNVNFKQSFAQGGLAGLSGEIHDYLQGYAQGGMVDEIHDYLQGYASGGEVKHFKIGGYNITPEDYNVNQSLIQQTAIPNVENLDFYRNQAETALGPSALTGYQDVLAKQRAEIEGRQKNYLPDFLIQAGLGMATSKGNLLQAAAEGAAQGFKFHQQSKQADEQAKRNLVDSEFKFKQAERAEKAGLFGLSRDLYKDATGQRNDAITQNRAAETLRLNSVAHRDDALAKAQELGISEKRLAIDASRAGSESALRKEQIENYKENRDIRRKLVDLQGKPKAMSGKDKLAAIASIQKNDPQYHALRASLEKAAKKDPAIAYTIQDELDNYIEERLKKYGDVYTAADLMGPSS
jgi:hypothetical protein